MSNNGIGGGLDNAKELFSRIGPTIGLVVLIGVIAIAGLSRVGCANHHTPPGYEGYIRSMPIAGAGKYIGFQTGPTSTGWVWRQEVVNIDVRPRTYSEEMSILTSRRLELKFHAHAVIRLRTGKVKRVVEEFGAENWYELNVRKQFRAAVRDEVTKYEPLEVKSKIDQIARHVKTVLDAEYNDKPVQFENIYIGNIEYPRVVVESVENKFVTQEDNERARIEKNIEVAKRLIRKARAKGTREAQHIIGLSLDPMYLQYEAIQAIDELADSENTTFLLMPFAKNGTTPPIMLNLDSGAAPTTKAKK